MRGADATLLVSLFSGAADTFMQRTKRLYADTRTAQMAASSNLDKLNEDLNDVTRIMTKNMEDLLWRGDSLDRGCYLFLCVRLQRERQLTFALLHAFRNVDNVELVTG